MRKWLAVLIALAGPAFAAPSLHVGPSVSLYELRLNGQVGQLTPGLGVQGWANFGSWCAGAAVFGSALGLGTSAPGYALSVAPYACYSPVGVCIGPGLDFAQVQGGVSGLLQGFTWKQNFFVVAQVLPKFWELLHISTQ